MIAGRSPLALTYTALAFGTVVAPFCFLSALMHLVMPLRIYVLITLIACSLILAERLIGWSKVDDWLKRQGWIVRVFAHAITLLALLCSLFILVSVAAFGGTSEDAMWFYVLVAVAAGTVIALLPVLLLKPSSFEQAFSLRFTSQKLNLLRLAAYGFLILLVVFACVQGVKFYQFNHPVY